MKAPLFVLALLALIFVACGAPQPQPAQQADLAIVYATPKPAVASGYDWTVERAQDTCATAVPVVQAAEGGTGNYLLGKRGPLAAFVPKPGWYLTNDVVALSADRSDPTLAGWSKAMQQGGEAAAPLRTAVDRRVVLCLDSVATSAPRSLAVPPGQFSPLRAACGLVHPAQAVLG